MRKRKPMNGEKRSISQAPNLESVAYLCRRVMTANLRDLQAVIPDIDVTIGQLGTLVLIACNPGITPTEICRAQGFEKPTITASLDKLERKKFIVRKSSSVDRRSFTLYLTKKGRSFYGAMLPLIRDSERRLTQSLTGEERAQLLELLRRIYYRECNGSVDRGFPIADAGKIHVPAARTFPQASRWSHSAKHAAHARAVDGAMTAQLGRRLKQMERQCAQLRKALHQIARSDG